MAIPLALKSISLSPFPNLRKKELAWNKTIRKKIQMAEFITDSNDNHSESTPAPPKVGLDMYLLLNLLRNY